ncbi:MAG TPA: hypothetical protein VKQ36_08705, partial [Ktedonobacterales bacterium]|nr:hypothetical protein [Ktedonobacterales bacterium]
MSNPLDSRRRKPWGLRVYRLALWAYPAAFRRIYGDEMTQVVRAAYHVARARGALALLRFWLWVFADLLLSSLAERKTSMRPSLALAVILTS